MSDFANTKNGEGSMLRGQEIFQASRVGYGNENRLFKSAMHDRLSHQTSISNFNQIDEMKK